MKSSWKIGTLLKKLMFTPEMGHFLYLFCFKKPFTPKNTGYPTLYFLLFHHHWPFWRRPREKPFSSELLDFFSRKILPRVWIFQGYPKISRLENFTPGAKGEINHRKFWRFSDWKCPFPAVCSSGVHVKQKINEKHYTGNPQHKKSLFEKSTEAGFEKYTIHLNQSQKSMDTKAAGI